MVNDQKKKRSKDYKGLFFIMPRLTSSSFLRLYPFLASLYYPSTQHSALGQPKFTGLDNYIRLFTTDPDFKKPIMVTVKYALISVPSKLFFVLTVILILSVRLKSINGFRTVHYILPILGGSVAVPMLWRLMFISDGILNKLLKLTGLPSVNWLGQAGAAMFTTCLLQVWQFGSSMVLFLAALKQIPVDLHEVASIDGAGKVKRFLCITLPIITPIVFFNLIMQTINALQNFTSAFVIISGGPLKSTYSIGMKLYTEGSSDFKMGYAFAISWTLLAIILILTLFIFESSDAWVYYKDGGDLQMKKHSAIMYILLVLVGLVITFPFIWMFFICFRTNAEILGSIRLPPSSFDLLTFSRGWNGVGNITFATYFKNIFVMVIPAVLLTVFSCSFVAYGFARFKSPFGKFFFALMISTLMPPNSVIIIPRYLIFNKVGLLDTYWPFYLPAVFARSPFFTFMIVQFLRGVPRELDEATCADGYSFLKIYFQILLPLIKPTLFSVDLFQFMWTWNDFPNTLIYIGSVKKFPVSLGLRASLDITAQVQRDRIMVTSMIGILSLTVLFFSAQKCLVKDISTTGLKR